MRAEDPQVFTAAALALTFPTWLTVSVLGRPDQGVIVAGYLGSLLMAGSYLAICACISATTRNQVIAFIVGVLAAYAIDQVLGVGISNRLFTVLVVALVGGLWYRLRNVV